MEPFLFRVCARSGLLVRQDERLPARVIGGPYRPTTLGEDMSRLTARIAAAFAGGGRTDVSPEVSSTLC
jgi:hypothetical protein